MTDYEANKKLSELVAAFQQALSEAEKFATEHKLSFSIEPTYGMGGYFDGAEVGTKNEWGDDCDGWFASSMSC